MGSSSQAVAVPLNFSKPMWVLVAATLAFIISQSMIAGGFSVAAIYFVRRFFAPWLSRLIGHRFNFFVSILPGFLFTVLLAGAANPANHPGALALLWLVLQLSWSGYAHRAVTEQDRELEQRLRSAFDKKLGNGSDWDLVVFKPEHDQGFAISRKLNQAAFSENGVFELKPLGAITDWEISIEGADYKDVVYVASGSRTQVFGAGVAGMLAQRSLDRSAERRAAAKSGLFLTIEEVGKPVRTFHVQSTDWDLLKGWKRTLDQLVDGSAGEVHAQPA